MNLDPRDTVEKPGTNPNRGMRTQPYMLIVIITVVVLLIIALVFVFARRSAGSPDAPATRSTTGRLAEPSVHKPSPLSRSFYLV